MRKPAMAAVAAAAAGLAAAPVAVLALAAGPSHSLPSPSLRSAYGVVEACATVTQKSASASANGQTFAATAAGVPRTCTGF